jgi:YD repeat-containing protein
VAFVQRKSVMNRVADVAMPVAKLETVAHTGRTIKVLEKGLFRYSNGTNPVTAANPCVTGSPAVNQGGALYERNDDGGAQTTEYVYNEAGQVVASEVNSDGWACTTYDSRGRVVEQTYPGSPSAPSSGRTVTTTTPYPTQP